VRPKHDGATLDAWWQARVERPGTWEEFLELPLIRTLEPELQAEIWRMIRPGDAKPSA